MFLRGFILENRLQNWNGGTDFSKKIFKKIEHVSYLIRYRKISLLIYSTNSSLSNVGLFFDSPGISFPFQKFLEEIRMSES